MTDEMIIKGLECIGREVIKCAECPYDEYCRYPTCHEVAGRDALYLIKRQKAEIERLQYLLDDEEKKYTNCAKRFYKEAIEDFAEAYKEQIKSCTGMFTDDGFYVPLDAVLRIVEFSKEQMIGEQK